MTDNDMEHGMQVANEQAANERYQKILKDLDGRRYLISVSRNTEWTKSVEPQQVKVVVGPLVGRIALDSPNDSVGGADFYIGPWHVEADGIAAFSWAAPIAKVFYDPMARNLPFGNVTCRRTLMLKESHVEGYVDEWLVEPADQPPFAHVRPLVIPQPPIAVPDGPVESTNLDDPEKFIETPLDEINQSVPVTRAEDALGKALAAPRGKALPTLLATLQPDQYNFVTRPLEPSLFIQGHPGTGKTVIAAHRAAWLLHPERDGSESAIRVLILGPNEQYASHIKSVLDSLVAVGEPQRVFVKSVQELMLDMRGLSGPGETLLKREDSMAGHKYDGHFQLSRIIAAAATRLPRNVLHPTATREARAKAVYKEAREKKAAAKEISGDQGLADYLEKLPPWGELVTQGRFLPLTAQCAVSAVPYKGPTYDHIIVDEAQDVLPLEWSLISLLNPNASWTILGDLNQSHSTWSYRDWPEVGRALGVIERDEKLEVSLFARGYRSTGRIMEFANQLLPASERVGMQVQTGGVQPRVYKVQTSKLSEMAYGVALDLRKKYQHGTVAVIAVNAEKIGKVFASWYWRKEGHVWVSGDRRIHLHTPESARGLEFDAVIVVEPSAFPTVLGRFGPLYTSLTRANRELAVVHSAPLPEQLRNKGLTAKIEDLSPTS